MQLDEEKDAFKHWQPFEVLRYNFFLVLNISKINNTQGRKEAKFYVKMSDFIGSKGKVQCRSHHEKKIKQAIKMTGINQKDKLERYNIRMFYKNYYTDRLMNQTQLIKQLKHHIAVKIGQNTQFQENYKEYYENVENLVDQLKFDDFKDVSQVSSQCK